MPSSHQARMPTASYEAYNGSEISSPRDINLAVSYKRGPRPAMRYPAHRDLHGLLWDIELRASAGTRQLSVWVLGVDVPSVCS